MKSRICGAIVALLVLGCSSVARATDITDNFFSDTTLTLAGSPYVVKQVTAVVTGATLTIEAGVEIQFDSGTGLTVLGAVVSQGTAGSPVVFRSSSLTPASGDWEQIYVVGNGSMFDHVEVYDSKFGIYQNLVSNDITNSLFDNNVHALTFANGGTPTVSGNTVTNNTHGLLILGGVSGGNTFQAQPTINNNQFSGQLGFNVLMINTTGDDLSALTIDAENNDWGTTLLSEIETKINDGLDDGISPIVDFNIPPVLNPISNQSVDENVLLSVPLSASDEVWDTITLSGTMLPAGAVVNDNGDGTGSLDWTPDYTQAGVYNVTVLATDVKGEFDQAPFTITVNNVNRAPTFNPTSAQAIAEGQLLTFNVSAIDLDGETLTMTAQQQGGGTLAALGAGFVDNGDNSGTFTWTPSFVQAGVYQIEFTAADAEPATDMLTVMITVTESNAATSIIYEYDDLNRLERVIRDTVITDYTMDEVGNIEQKETY